MNKTKMILSKMMPRAAAPAMAVVGMSLGLTFGASGASAENKQKPNILWIYIEDLSPWFACYGDKINQGHTPVVDGMAKAGTMFSRCMMPSPTCSTTRSALITGTHQGTFGLHNHRSSRTESSRIFLPKGVKTLPELFQAQGYETFNQGKDDYNFAYERSKVYTGGKHAKKSVSQTQSGSGTSGKAAWDVVPKGKPWFGQIQLKGGKGKAKGDFPKVTAEQITLPPYFPNEPVFVNEWVNHYNNVRLTDLQAGQILGQLKADGILDNTVVFFFSDHGSNKSLRHKQFCYEGGVHVPLLVTGPGVPKQTKRDDLVSGLDISVTSMKLAGAPVPEYMQGDDLFAADYKQKDHVVSARDRCDFTIDQIRTVRTDKFRYLKNGKLDRPLLQSQYRDGQAPTKRLRELHKEGKLGEIPTACFFGKRPAEELYDMEKDPHQVNNLAGDPKYAEVLKQHQDLLQAWIKSTGDKGQLPESKEGLKATMQRWKARCVNPEYDAVK